MRYLILIILFIISCNCNVHNVPRDVQNVPQEEVCVSRDDWYLIVNHAKDLDSLFEQLNNTGVLEKLESSMSEAIEVIKQVQDLIDTILFSRAG